MKLDLILSFNKSNVFNLLLKKYSFGSDTLRRLTSVMGIERGKELDTVTVHLPLLLAVLLQNSFLR